MTAKLYLACDDVDAHIAKLARVSSENPDNPEYEKLIGYLIKHGHWSPFDMINVVIEVETTKDIAIQILRHRGFAVQEYSQRYADCSEMIAGLRECRLQHKTNRQLSVDCDDNWVISAWLNIQSMVIDRAFGAYDDAISLGIAREQARAILPIGLTTTKMYLNGSIRTWLFYIKSRIDETSQREHQQLARECLDILIEVAPCTTRAFCNHFGIEL